MFNKQPLKKILTLARAQWDCAETRPAVWDNFHRVLVCRTADLGAEVYASDTEEKMVYHTCKSRACPSCGWLATELWQRQMRSVLPDVPYVGMVFTMPDVLWSIFRQNRDLFHDLAVLGAGVIQQWAKSKYGVRLIVMVVPHTFGRHLTFNSHLHILVSAGGLRLSEGRWIRSLHFDRSALMHMWRYAVITYLREALKAQALRSDLSAGELGRILKTQYERWWNIKIDRSMSKSQFLRYAGRYVRRPPIAQHRFVEITDGTVRFWTKDLKLKRRVITEYSLGKFVAALAEHIPDRYRHAIRYFGLLAPRSKNQTSAAAFVLLGQQKRPRPRRLGWAGSLQNCFGVNPLIDNSGHPMCWVRRLGPATQSM